MIGAEITPDRRAAGGALGDRPRRVRAVVPADHARPAAGAEGGVRAHAGRRRRVRGGLDRGSGAGRDRISERGDPDARSEKLDDSDCTIANRPSSPKLQLAGLSRFALPRHLRRPLLPARRAASRGRRRARLARAAVDSPARCGCRWWRRATCTTTCPARMVLHDVLTAIRHGTTVAAPRGRCLFPNAERHLRSLDEIRAIFAARAGRARAHRRDRRPLHVSRSTSCGTNIRRARARGPDAARVSHAARLARGGRALPGRAAREGPRADRARAGADRRAALRGLLSHRVGPGPLRPVAEHPVPGPRVGGQLGRLLLPGRHVGRSRRRATCCSSGSSAASGTRRPTSTSTSSTSGARRCCNTSTTSTAASGPG